MTGVVFGPRSLVTDRDCASGHKLRMQGVTCQQAHVQICNCVGPQPGETKCPCALAHEVERGRRMVEEGVVVNGRRYRLVPE